MVMIQQKLFLTDKEKLLCLVAQIKNPDIRAMTLDMLLNVVPKYFWKVPASSTGRHHPSFALGEGGLVRHTIAATIVLKHLVNLEYLTSKYGTKTQDIIDCMMSAIILHDTFKCGTQEQYEQALHDLDSNKGLMMEGHELLVPIPNVNAMWADMQDYKEWQFIVQCKTIYSLIACHMGQWGKRQPETTPELFVHQADYLASRKNILIDLEDLSQYE